MQIQHFLPWNKADIEHSCKSQLYNPDLISPRQIQPMEYIRGKTKPLDHDVTIEVISIYM